MIDKREILAIAQQTSLTPHVVEKDYVLGWMLAGIYGHEDLAENWIFKGGTCLKKCFFETFRFSEDLDFTLRKPEHLDAYFLKGAFLQLVNGSMTKPALRYLSTNRTSISTRTPAANSHAKARSATKALSLRPMPSRA